MNLRRVLPRFQYAQSRTGITAYAGLPVIAQFAESLSLFARIEQGLGFLKRRQRGYQVWQFVSNLVLLLIAGGESLTDIRMLESDPSLKRLLGQPRLPAATTLAQFLRRFNHRAVQALSRVSSLLATKALLPGGLTRVTLDFDATLIESHKRAAQYTYEKFPGYDPLLCFIGETQMVLRGLFRPGNASPSGNALSFLRGCIRRLPDWVSQLSVRSDAAWYNHEVMDFCQKQNIRFAISATMTEALLAAIRAIPENRWRHFSRTRQIAETVHVVGDSPNAYRVIALRESARQTDIFTGGYCYRAVITNINDWRPASIIRWQRRRATAENIIKELKHGFGLNRLPCGDLLANAGYFEANILAYNLVQAFKRLTLPEGWQHWQIKRLRFRLFNVGATVVRHARGLVLRIPADYPHWSVLTESRRRVLALAAR
ncbi:IS1380 family transposase [candidate division WOR-3 bacterium]|nr:IS1380 family transposase [candidate division WOR-3 bacterium]